MSGAFVDLLIEQLFLTFPAENCSLSSIEVVASVVSGEVSGSSQVVFPKHRDQIMTEGF